MQRAADGAAAALFIVLLPEDAVIGLALRVGFRERRRLGHLSDPVAVDIRRIKRGKACSIARDKRAAADTLQLPVPQGQNIRHLAAFTENTRYKKRGFPACQCAARQAAHLRGGHRKSHGGLQFKRLPAEIAVGDGTVLLIAADHDQLLLPGSVHITGNVAEIARREKRHRLSRAQTDDRESLHVEIAAKAHQDLFVAVCVEIRISNAVNRVRAAFDLIGKLVIISRGAENVDLHRFFIVVFPQQRDRLLDVIPVEIHHLNALQIAARRRSSVFRTGGKQRIDLLLKRLVLARKPRQAVKTFAGIVKHAAGKRCKQHYGKQQCFPLFHPFALLSRSVPL